MRKNTTRAKLLQDRPLNDDDIKQVFDAQDVSIPEGIDKVIFEQAELTAAQARPRTRTSWPTHAFAIAATVVLAIVLAPALMREPVNPEETRIAADQSIAADDMAESLASPSQLTSLSTRSSERKLAETEEPIEAMNEETDNSVSITAESIPAYRSTAEQWINRIKIMIIDGDSDKARAEYLLLEKQFPEKAREFNPDFDARAIQTEPLGDDNDLQGN